MGIKDEFHQKNILVCIEELCQPPSSPTLPGTDGTSIKSSSTVSTLSGNEVSVSSSVGCVSSTSTSGTSSCTGSSNAVSTPGNTPTTANSHNLVPHSFSVLERCDKCHKYLRGLLHQGFLCQGTHILSWFLPPKLDEHSDDPKNFWTIVDRKIKLWCTQEKLQDEKGEQKKP